MLLCAIVVHFTKRKGLRYVSKFSENAWIFGDSVVDAKARGWINWIMIPNMSNLAKGFFDEYKRNQGCKVFLSKPCNEAYKGTGVCRDQDHQDYAYPDASAESKSQIIPIQAPRTCKEINVYLYFRELSNRPS